MNVNLKEVRKFEIPLILNDESIWRHNFLIGTKQRLLAHFNNSKADDNDIALLIAYLDDKIVGYMGIYIDQIHLGNDIHKIGWLSTWWLHSSSSGRGIGREMLKRMYELNDGKIGISQFTKSAKRVYDKSGFFYYLKLLEGCKIDLRMNLQFLLPSYKKSFRKFIFPLKVFDAMFNSINDLKLKLVYSNYKKSLKGYSIDYLTYIDTKTRSFLDEQQKNSLTRRDGDFFQFIKTFQWIEEAPLVEFVENEKKFLFSGYNRSFNIYLVKITDENSEIVGFISLLKKDHELKVLQVFYQADKHPLIAKVIIMHGISLGTKTIITYDEKITTEFKQLKFSKIRFKKKERESIISKSYGENDYEKFDFQYGDGDCSFA